jgi:hypothetical protein
MMSRSASPWLTAAVVTLVAMGASGSRAGEGPEGGASADQFTLNQATAERSWAIQGELARIDQGREAFVDELIKSWTPYLDSAVYDPWTELKPIAMKAPSWQLYGASLVGDFHTMVRLLRGEIGAGRYVNALVRPQARMPVIRQALGDTATALVFTPIEPCRMVDTRGTGVRTGIVNPGTPRVFDLTTSGFAKGQGGAAACAGLPSFSNLGWAANITVTGHTTSGNVRVYPFSGTLPTTSFINFFPAASALANAGTLTGCYGCADDVTIAAFGGPTHVIIDVMGYYAEATGTSAAVSRVAGAATNVPNGSFAFVTSGACPAGTVLVGGEMDHNAGDLAIGEYHENTPTTWIFWMINNSAAAGSATAFARCLDQPVRIP